MLQHGTASIPEQKNKSPVSIEKGLKEAGESQVNNKQVRTARYAVRMAVAASLSASLGAATMTAVAAEAASSQTEDAEEVELDEVTVTGSRIVRRDLQSNSPLVTVERQQIDDSTFISLEEALNDLPQFMAGGVNNSAASVTNLQAANGLDG